MTNFSPPPMLAQLPLILWLINFSPPPLHAQLSLTPSLIDIATTTNSPDFLFHGWLSLFWPHGWSILAHCNADSFTTIVGLASYDFITNEFLFVVAGSPSFDSIVDQFFPIAAIDYSTTTACSNSFDSMIHWFLFTVVGSPLFDSTVDQFMPNVVTRSPFVDSTVD